MPLKLDYYYGGEAEQYSFYRIPKPLFTEESYQPLTMEAKVLYGLLLDRMSLSARNGWLDGAGRVYIFFTLADAIAMLGVGHNKAVRLFRELEDIGLIERRKQGQGKPTVIYVKNFVLSPEPEQVPPPAPETPPETSQNGKSAHPADSMRGAETSFFGKSALPSGGSQDFPKRNANKTERNKTEINETDLSIPSTAPAPQSKRNRAQRGDGMEEMEIYREIIRENIDYDILAQDQPMDIDLIDGYVELMAETCCTGRKTVRVNQEAMPAAVVKSRFLKLDREHISYVLDCMKKNTTRIGNIKAYMLSALYNAPVTIGQYYTSLVSHDMAEGFV